MKFFYQSGAMGYGGEGWLWHKVMGYTFPKLPVITKTITYAPKKGNLYFVVPFFNSVYNKVGLHNMGLREWVSSYYREDLILSIFCDNDSFINKIHDALLYQMRHEDRVLEGIELNISCPNFNYGGEENYVNVFLNALGLTFKKQGYIKKLYLKVNHTQDLSRYDLQQVDMINLNSVRMFGGGISGKIAKKYNWTFIDKWQNKPYIPPISGCSWSSFEDITTLENMGCKSVGIGSTIITNPKLVERIKEYGRV